MMISPAVPRLKDRKILVTGAAAGIGRAISELFVEEGAEIAMLDLPSSDIDQTAKSIGGKAVPFDLRRLAEVDFMIGRVAEQLGGLSGVVNCAAYAVPLALKDTTMDDLHKFHDVNLLAPILICKAARPYLLQHDTGSIVNIASGQGLLPNIPDNTVYAATKGGLIAFTRSLAAELAPHIRVNAVAPGGTRTAMTAGLVSEYEEISQAPFVQQYAMKRLAEPSEIAKGVLFLISEEASYVTGSTLAVDGGRCFH